MKVTEMIVEALSTEELIGFCKGEAIICMAGGDLEKARGYIDLAIKAKEPEEVPEEEPEPPKEKKPKKKPTPIDRGKIIALYNGKWPVKEIALEMGISEQTVRNHIHQEKMQ